MGTRTHGQNRAVVTVQHAKCHVRIKKRQRKFLLQNVLEIFVPIFFSGKSECTFFTCHFRQVCRQRRRDSRKSNGGKIGSSSVCGNLHARTCRTCIFWSYPLCHKTGIEVNKENLESNSFQLFYDRRFLIRKNIQFQASRQSPIVGSQFLRDSHIQDHYVLHSSESGTKEIDVLFSENYSTN